MVHMQATARLSSAHARQGHLRLRSRGGDEAGWHWLSRLTGGRLCARAHTRTFGSARTRASAHASARARPCA